MIIMARMISGWMNESTIMSALLSARIDSKHFHIDNVNVKGKPSLTCEDMPLDELIHHAMQNAVQFRLVQVDLPDYVCTFLEYKG
jgi:hypothetical protein